jgi:uncharacterized protein YktA (UPF0223 family)
VKIAACSLMKMHQGIPGFVKIVIERGDAIREIEVVENIISVLDKCFKMHIKTKQYIEASRCFRDIQKCKKELKRLKDQAAESAHNG